MLALFVSALRVLSPHAEHVKKPIQDWFLANYDFKLRYTDLNVQWKDFGLYLTLNDVDIDPTSGPDQVKHLNSMGFKVDLWSTLVAFNLRFGRIQMQGLELDLAPFEVNEDLPETNSSPWQLLLLELASSRFTEFELYDLTMHLSRDAKQLDSIVVPHLSWRNSGNHHRGEGSAHILGYDQQVVGFVVDIEGHRNSPEDITGRFYGSVENLSAHAFIRQWLNRSVEIVDSKINLETWIDFDWNRVTQGAVQFGENKLNWNRAGEPREVVISSGVVGYAYEHGGWQAWLDGLDASTNGLKWNDFTARFEQQNNVFTAAIERADLKTLLPLVEFSPLTHPVLSELSSVMSGSIDDVRLWFASPDDWRLSADLRHVGWNKTQSLPGVSLLDGQLYANQSEFQFEIDAPAQVIEATGHFYQDIELERLAGRVNGQRLEQGWAIDISQLDIEATDLSARLSGLLRTDEVASPELYLYGELSVAEAGHAWYYFPLKAMGQDLSDYLKSSIQSGVIEGAQVLWHGRLGDFPFANHDGKFQVDVPLRASRFEFDAHWPALEPLDLDLQFENSDLTMVGQTAYLLDAKVENLVAKIPGLREDSVLEIDGTVVANASQVRAVMSQSMLADSVGKTLELMNVQGPVSGPLHLEIPLDHDDVKVSGYAQFDKANLFIPGSTAHQLEDVNGRVYYQQDAISIEDLSGSYQGLPVTLNVSGASNAQTYQVNASVAGQWPVAGVNKLIELELPAIEGSVQWDAGVKVDIDDGGVTTHITVNSDLAALDLALPEPLVKPLGTAWPTTVHLQISPTQILNGQMSINDLIVGDWKVDLNSEQPSDYVWLSLGQEQQGAIRVPGITFDIHQSQFDIAPWIEYVASIKTDSAKSLPFEYGHWQFDKLFIGDWSLNKVDTRVSRIDHGWTAAIQADSTDADLTYLDGQQPMVKLAAAKLLIQSPEKAPAKDETNDSDDPHTEIGSPVELSQTPMITLASIPDLQLDCRLCQVGEHYVDEVRLYSSTDADAGTWTASEAWIKAGTGEIKLSEWQWTVTDDSSTTHLTGVMQAKNFETMMTTMMPNKELPIRQSSADGSFDFTWSGAPYDVTPEQLNGHFKWTLGSGHIAELSDKGARVFSLLSIGSLVRKMRLDFSDVFDKGLFYDRFRGEFKFKDGVVSSDKVQMDGVAGDMTISGSTNLKTMTLDYDVVFHPDLTSSLPLLAGLTINPITGIYVLALHAVMKPVVEVVTQVRFKVSGTTENPIVTEVDRSSREVELQQPAAPPVNSSEAVSMNATPIQAVVNDVSPGTSKPLSQQPEAQTSEPLPSPVLLPEIPVQPAITVGDEDD